MGDGEKFHMGLGEIDNILFVMNTLKKREVIPGNRLRPDTEMMTFPDVVSPFISGDVIRFPTPKLVYFLVIRDGNYIVTIFSILMVNFICRIPAIGNTSPGIGGHLKIALPPLS
jgi:hypothetical protein